MLCILWVTKAIDSPSSPFAACEFHITSHLLCWASGGGATNSPSHVHYMGVSYSR